MKREDKYFLIKRNLIYGRNKSENDLLIAF